MLAKQNRKQRFIKKHYYQDLAQRFSRTESSFEYRMQNISYVFAEMGRTYISGLLPAKNIGTATAEKIEKLINQKERFIKALPHTRLISGLWRTLKPRKSRKVLPNPTSTIQHMKSLHEIHELRHGC